MSAAEPIEAMHVALDYIQPVWDALALARRDARTDEIEVYEQAQEFLELQENWLLSGIVRSLEYDEGGLFAESMSLDEARTRLEASNAKRRHVVRPAIRGYRP